MAFTRPVPPTYANCNRLWVDSRPRAYAQRHLEAATLRRLGGRVDGGRVLEIGTGRRGTGLRLALEVFGARRADGVELYPASVAACRRAVADLGGRVGVEQADATALPAADGTYDAVFCYHLLHHAADWRAAVVEAARVLVPGGRLYAVEMTASFVDSRALRAVSRHPADGDRPDPAGLRAAVSAAGLELVADRGRFHGWWLASVSRRPSGKP